MKDKNFRSISTKLVALLSLSATIALLLSFVTILVYSFYENKANRLNILSLTTEVIGQNLIAAIDFDDSASAKSTLSSLSLIKDIEGVFLFKDFDNVFSSYINNSSDENSLIKITQDLYKTKNIKTRVNYIDFKHIIVSNPIYFQKEYIATPCIISNTDTLKKSFIDKSLLLLMVFLITLVIIVLLSLRMQKIFTRPIFKMKDIIEHITINKSYDITIKAQENDEFKVLFDGFNYMIATIKENTLDLEKAKKEIDEVHKKTKASIEYAALIQSALIPEFKVFRKYFKDHFAIWHPKDLVGGDIYLFEELRHEDECILMVIDCTGHGVSGAFVTMIVKAIERQIVERIRHSDEVVSPARLLTVFNFTMKQLLKQVDSSSISNVGFDGQIIYYNKKEQIIKCASARNDMFYYQNDELHVIKGDRHSVGYKDSDVNYKFSEHTIDTSSSVTFYALTDGFWDQNGGNKNFPFGKRRFKTMLNDIYSESMADQQEEFLYSFEMYRNKHEINDDITIIGFKT